jgi:uncharacterized membrane protein
VRRRATLATAAVAGVAVADVVAALRLSSIAKSARNGHTGKGRVAINARGWITVNRPVEEALSAYWQNLENLPRFMTHLQSVQAMSEGRSRAAGPAGVEIEWDTEISNQRINELIAWYSIGDGSVQTGGKSCSARRLAGEAPRSASGSAMTRPRERWGHHRQAVRRGSRPAAAR